MPGVMCVHRICCLSSEIWTKLIATMGIIYNVISILLELIIWSQSQLHISKTDEQIQSNEWPSLKLMLILIDLLMNSILLYSSFKLISKLLQLWIVYTITAITIIWIDHAWNLSHDSSMDQPTFYILVETGWKFFTIFVIFSLVRQIRDEDETPEGNSQKFEEQTQFFGGSTVRPMEPHLKKHFNFNISRSVAYN